MLIGQVVNILAGRTRWLFVTGLVGVAARKIVVLREQNPDSGLVVQPSLSHYAKKLITARLSPPFSAPLKCTLNDGANPYRTLTERSHTLRVIDWTFFFPLSLFKYGRRHALLSRGLNNVFPP